MGDDSKKLSQAEIDALIAGYTGSAPTDTPAESATDSPSPAPAEETPHEEAASPLPQFAIEGAADAEDLFSGSGDGLFKWADEGLVDDTGGEGEVKDWAEDDLFK